MFWIFLPAAVFFMLPLLYEIILSANKAKEEKQKLIAKEQLRLQREEEKAIKRERERQERLLREEQKAIIRQKEKEARELEKRAAASNNTINFLFEKISAPSSISSLNASLSKARTDFITIEFELLDTSNIKRYTFVKDTLLQTNSAILNRYIQTRFDSICYEALSPMPLNIFYDRLRSMFSEVNRSSNTIPDATLDFVQRLQRKVGLYE
ncbi:MAG: hypothetical protein E7322_05805 [Clostridiales bacterium]|nr:hypothetical protein [Clostridiales bacterium]